MKVSSPYIPLSTLLLAMFIHITSVSAETGIKLIRDIYPGSNPSSPIMITDVNGSAFFLAKSGDTYGGHEYGLWHSDGTTEGTQFIIDLDNPEYSGTYGEFTAFNNLLIFRARTSDGDELWKSDGTAAGTVMIKDIYPGQNSVGHANSSYPENLTAIDLDGDQQDDIVVFTARTKEYGKELWRTDGTTEGTYLIKNIHEGSASLDSDSISSHTMSYAVMNNIFYFTAIATPYTDNTGSYIGGYELWRSDGTNSGTYLVKDLTPFINIPYGPGSSNPWNLTTLNNTLIFSASAKDIGNELFKSDGSFAGTVLLKDINPNGSSSPSNMLQVDDKIYFFADDGTHGRELWVTDGSSAGTHLVKDFVAGNAGITNSFAVSSSSRDRAVFDNMTAFKGQLFFRFNDGSANHGFELWKSDGTEEGTYLVKDIATSVDSSGYANSSYPDELTVVGNILYFSAWDPVFYRELWQSDGTAEGTMMVADLQYDDQIPWASSNPSQLSNINNSLFFSAHTDGFGETPWVGRELWTISDATPPLIPLRQSTAEFDANTGKLTIDVIEVQDISGTTNYSAVLFIVPSSNPLLLELDLDQVTTTDNEHKKIAATFNNTGKLTIPNVQANNTLYHLTLQLVSSNPIQFSVLAVSLQQ
jgi:ELWxxDGT repeat protein